MVGDGICNDEANHFECNYDGGDCCGPCVIKKYCLDCACYHEVTANLAYNPLIHDGFCNDETNTPECNYDGGDCCGSCVVKTYCSDCQCLGGDNNGNDISHHPLIGDGYCHDDNNVAVCDYDGGDCCGYCVVKHYCSDCECLDPNPCLVGSCQVEGE